MTNHQQPDTKTLDERVKKAFERQWTTRMWRYFIGVMSFLGPTIIIVFLYAHRGFIEESIRMALKGYIEKERYEREQAVLIQRVGDLERSRAETVVLIQQGQMSLLQKMSDMDRRLATMEGKLDRSLAK